MAYGRRSGVWFTRFLTVAVLAIGGFDSAPRSVAADAPHLTLIDPAGTLPEIFVDARASEPEKFAARELQSALEKMTGRTLVLRTDHWIQGAPTGKYIAIGKSRFTEDLDVSGLATEQYLIDVTANRLAIVGGRDRQRGVLYGVYELLEQLGVRWYRPEPWGEHVPKSPAVVLPLGRKVGAVPQYAYRSGVAGGFTRNAEPTLDESDWASLWAVRNRLNGPDPGVDRRNGGNVSLSFDHIYYQLIPVDEYFDKHPEYFCLYHGQRRRANPDSTPRPDNPTGLQLCLSNPDLQNLFAEKIIAKARACSDLSSASFSATPNDACPFCECDACRAMDDPRDPTSMSNRVCAFTNIVARKVGQAVPGARLSLNAYSTWTSPPTIVERIEPNVLIHIALINDWADYTRRFDDATPNWNRRAVESFGRWKELGVSEIYTYEYWGGYGWPGPLPLARTLADRVRQYRPFNVRGIYNETAPSWGPQGLELYLFAKLIWQPDLDLDAELSSYYRNYYGPAEAPMKAYHEALMNAFERSPMPVYSGGRGMHALLTPKLLADSGASLDEARRRVAGQPLYERRLHGVIAGHEFARRIAEILRIKKQEGKSVPIAGHRGTILQSAKAEKAYAELLGWIERYEGLDRDAVFDVLVRGKTATVYYVDGDVLRNDAFGYAREEDLLKDF